MVLLNHVLSAIPLYYLAMFRIPKWVIYKINQIRKCFLWAGVENFIRRKYYLVHWDIVCRAKENGGGGILNLEQMNYALLYKWGWKLLYRDSQGI